MSRIRPRSPGRSLLSLAVFASASLSPSCRTSDEEVRPRTTQERPPATAEDAGPSVDPARVAGGPSTSEAPRAPVEIATAPRYADWPRIASALRRDEAQEAWIAERVARMTLAQKVGQMTQAETPRVSPADVRAHYIGSVLAGAGAWPVTKNGTAAQWVAVADALWEASMTTDMETPVPIIFGVDAVHGNQKQLGATLFPHNIGLGATRDPDLVARIGAFTAQQMRVSGVDYNFAPCVAVPRDDRWGRTYEGYSESPDIARALGGALTRGLMDVDASGTSFRGVITAAKHFVGDGSTHRGVDRGVSRASEQELINVHAQGYYGAIEAGNQTIMVSYNSWIHPGTDMPEKIHGSEYLLTTVLKQKIGFDGLVISDYRGIEEVSGCTRTRCAEAINAGIDLFMVADDWKQFIRETMELVESGEVPMARIDDAVARILRVKLRAGLFDAPRPSQRPDAGSSDKLVARALGREAAQKSAVLLKNNGKLLPLDADLRVLVVGKSADSLPNQNGGWSLGWQSTPPVDRNTNASFPNGQTLLAGIREVVGGENVTHDPLGTSVDPADYDVVIAVIGELPYAEFGGDIVWNPLVNWGPTQGALPRDYVPKQTLEHAVRHPEDLAVLDRVSGRGVPVVTVFFSGRPLYANKELNRSDAFVAAWLPGTEGGAIAELLFRRAEGTPALDFHGRLSYSWPRHACQTSLNVGQTPYDPLFAFGYGLRLDDTVTVPQLPETPGPASGCAE